MWFKMKYSGPTKNFVEHTYKERVVVENYLTVVRHPETRDRLLQLGFELVCEVEDGTKLD